jgi:hypothetical protein
LVPRSRRGQFAGQSLISGLGALAPEHDFNRFRIGPPKGNNFPIDKIGLGKF